MASVVNRFETARSNFVACGWEDLTDYMAPIQESELQFKSRKNELTLESGRVLKRRFESFNSEFDELHTAERALSVPDSTLRAELRKTISERLVPPWSEFYYKYVKYQFSKKHMDQYTRLSPAVVEDKLNELLAGL
eukprot:CAMPEP_0182585824 /NCGR_PEP_ID=MMETSP1324-20130603/61206_1 /TAXON_ID=236786 /ORGANISM="Florenciella sp., Strain RCC1587" /LENGTH=135 /DNA_ID=CAMNT_0024802649 /DNA_START=18 /DNA_END=425 /DNA_ORIENTATION=+